VLTASYGHEIAILNEISGEADYIAYDTIFLRGVGASIEGAKLLEVSGEEGITAVYRAGKCYVIRRITTGNGYHDRVLVFNPTDSPVEVDVAFSYSTPFEDVLEADWGRVERHPLQEGNTLVWKGADGRVRRLRIEEKSGKITVAPRSTEMCFLRATPSVEGGYPLAPPLPAGIKLDFLVPRAEPYIGGMAARDLERLLVRVDGNLFPLAGIPYFAAIFGRDSLWTSFFLLDAFPELARGVLLTLARLQGRKMDERSEEEPGKIPHEYRFGELCQAGRIPFSPYYGSVDSTPLYVALAGEYLARTGDRGTVRTLRESLTSAVGWILRRLEEGEGYIRYGRGLLENQGWKDWKGSIPDESGEQAVHPIALVEVQAYAYWALRLAGELGLTDLDEEMLLKTARGLRERFNRDFWTDEHYALALDGRGRAVGVASSNMGHVLITGIADRVDETAERLFRPDLFSGLGVRTLGTEERAYNPMSYHNGSVWPHDNAIICLGLLRAGKVREARMLARAQLKAFRALGKIPELFAGFSEPVPVPYANCPQAWSAASALAMLRVLEVEENES